MSFTVAHLKLLGLTLALTLTQQVGMAQPTNPSRVISSEAIAGNGTINPEFQETEVDVKDENAEPIRSLFTGLNQALTSLISHTVILFGDTSLSGSLSLPVKLVKGVGIPLNYSFEIEPSYVGGNYFTRMDEYKVGVELLPGKWLLSDNSPLTMRFAPSSMIRVYRIKESFHDALSPNPNIPLMDWVPFDYLPNTSERILRNFKEGEMVHMRVPLYTDFGVSKKFENNGSFSVSRIKKGTFDVFVFRGSNNKVRLRIIPHKEDGWEAKVNFDADKSHLNLALKALMKLFGGSHVFDLDTFLGDKALYVADYTLDFNNTEVRAIYDQVFGKTVSLTSIDGLKEAAKKLKIVLSDDTAKDVVRQALVNSLAPIDKIAIEDMNEPDPEKRRVHINHMGNDLSDKNIDISYGFGVPFLGSIDFRRALYNHIYSRVTYNKNKSDQWAPYREHYIFPGWTDNSHYKSRLLQYEEMFFRSANVIRKVDKDKKIDEFFSIGFKYEMRDNKYDARDHFNFLKHLRNVLPAHLYPEIFEKMREKGIADLGKPILKKARILLNYFITREGFDAAVERFNQREPNGRYPNREQNTLRIMRIVADHVRKLDLPIIIQTDGDIALDARCLKAGIDGSQMAFDQMAAHYCYEIIEISKGLADIMSPFLDPDVRQSSLNSLLKFRLFREAGPAFLFLLIPDNHIPNVTRIELQVQSVKIKEPIRIAFGETKDRELYDELMQQQDILANERPDLRLPGEKDTLTTRRPN